MLLGDELLAWHEIQQIEHFLIQHLPGADLLLDHVGAGLLYVHSERDYNLALRRGPTKVGERVP